MPITAFISSTSNPSADEQSWENEGGVTGYTVHRIATPQSVQRAAFDRRAGDIDAMARRLNDDFVNGRIGTRQHMYAHRARVLRQLRAALASERRQAGS